MSDILNGIRSVFSSSAAISSCGKKNTPLEKKKTDKQEVNSKQEPKLKLLPCSIQFAPPWKDIGFEELGEKPKDIKLVFKGWLIGPFNSKVLSIEFGFVKIDNAFDFDKMEIKFYPDKSIEVEIKSISPQSSDGESPTELELEAKIIRSWVSRPGPEVYRAFRVKLGNEVLGTYQVD